MRLNSVVLTDVNVKSTSKFVKRSSVCVRALIYIYWQKTSDHVVSVPTVNTYRYPCHDLYATRIVRA